MSNLLISYHATSEAKGGGFPPPSFTHEVAAGAFLPRAQAKGETDDLSIRRSPVSRVHTKGAGPHLLTGFFPIPAGGKPGVLAKGLSESFQASYGDDRTSVPLSVGWLLRLSEFSSLRKQLIRIGHV